MVEKRGRAYPKASTRRATTYAMPLGVLRATQRDTGARRGGARRRRRRVDVAKARVTESRIEIRFRSARRGKRAPEMKLRPALYDTGAHVSIITTEELKATSAWATYKPGGPIASRTILEGVEGTAVLPEGHVELEFETPDGTSYKQEFFVTNEAVHNIILGWDFIRKYRARLDPQGWVDFLANGGRAELQTRERERLVAVQRTVAVLRARTDTVIRANTQQMLTVQATEASWAIEGTMALSKPRDKAEGSEHDLDVAHGFDWLGAEGITKLLVANQSKHDRTIKKGEPIGSLTMMNCAQAMAAGNSTAQNERRQAEKRIQDKEQTSDEAKEILELLDVDWDNWNKQEKQQIQSFVEKHKDRFHNRLSKLGVIDVAAHTIKLEEGMQPVTGPPRRFNPTMEGFLKEKIAEMLEQDIIRRSTSPWGAGVVLTPKKDGTYRVNIDYRRLNEGTVFDSYPMPRVDDALQALGGARLFSTFDLQSGYWQIEMDEKSKEMTAFVTKEGLFEWNRMPMGLKCSPATFCRAMAMILNGLTWINCLVYLDDVLCFSASSNLEEHLKMVDQVFERFAEYNVTVNPRKSAIGKRRVVYLGHVVTAEGITTDPKLVQAMMGYIQPTNKRELRGFLGLCSYYREFVPNFATTAAPLTDLVGPKAAWKWEQEQQTAFDKLKHKLAQAPVLAHPDFTRTFYLQPDASKTGLGAVLCQRDDDGREHPITYISRRTRGKGERTANARRSEAGCIYWAVKKLRRFLEGQKFVVQTDHEPLAYLRKEQKDATLRRMLLELEHFTFDVVYKPGRLHTNADAMNRQYEAEEDVVEAMPGPGAPEDEAPYSDEEDREIMENHMFDGLHQLLPVRGRTNTADEATTQYNQEVRRAQLEEKDLQAAIWILEGRKEEEEWSEAQRKRGAELAEQCEMMNGVLVRVWNQRGTYANNRTRNWIQVVEPKSRRRQKLTEAHDTPLGGHFGINRTLQKLQRTSYWPDMARDVHDWVKTCRKCEKAKKTRPKKQGLRQVIESLYRLPWIDIHVDHVGPFERSRRGHFLHCLSATCRVTRATVFIPTKGTTAAETARALMTLWLRKGFPMKVTTDRGSAFKNELLTTVEQTLGFRVAMTVARRAEGNGLAERPHRYLNTFYRTLDEDKRREWPELVDYLTFAYGMTPHPATQETPHYLEHGRDLRFPTDVMLDDLSDTARELTRKDFRRTAQELARRMKMAREVAAQFDLAARTAAAGKANQQRTERAFPIGTLIWLAERPQAEAATSERASRRHVTKLSGPWRITRRPHQHATVYELEHLRDAKTTTANVDMMVPLFTAGSSPLPFRRRDPRLRPAKRTVPVTTDNRGPEDEEDYESSSSEDASDDEDYQE